MAQRRAAEVRLARAAHYNHLEMSSRDSFFKKNFSLQRLNIMTCVFQRENKTASVCWGGSKYGGMLKAETSRRGIESDVTGI